MTSWSIRVSTTVLALVVCSVATAERARNPAEATVFIRVVGTARVEIRDAFSVTEEERDVELGTGSGFVFTPYGHVLTNHHVIEDTLIESRAGRRNVQMELLVDRIEVVLPDNEISRFDASIEAVDPELDLAVLSIAGGELPYLGLGDSDAATQGDSVAVYGFPFGRQVEVGKTNVPDIVPRVSASRGSMSAARADDSGNAAYLQTTATVNPGNSGGPMVDELGYVLGVVRLKLKDADGIGFAIPVNTVKDFLTFNGYEQLLPVERLRLGPEQELFGKGLALRLPDTLEDVSPTKLRAFSDPGAGAIRFSSDRVVTSWPLTRLEQALLSGGTFGAFQTSAEVESTTVDGSILGRSQGRDMATADELSIVYLLLEQGAETLVVRYVGDADAVAFNRSVLLESLRSVRAEELLTDELESTIPPDALSWTARALPDPRAPRILVPEGWDEEVSAPFACQGLPAWDTALATSPPGDFTVSLRAGWWSESMSASGAASACSERAGALGRGSYSYTVDWLGERYVVEGVFVERDGTLQLEVVALQEKHGFIRDAARAWMERNR